MPDRGIGGGGALTPLAQAYDVDVQGYQSLLGAVQERVRLRQQARMLDEELERRKELTTFKLEEQDRIRRQFYYDIEQPDAEAQAEQQAIEQRIEAEKEINNRIDSSRREINQFMTSRKHLSTIPIFRIPTDFAYSEERGVILQNPTTGEVHTPQEYQSLVASYDNVERFIEDFYNNIDVISSDSIEDSDGVTYLNRSEAVQKVAKLRNSLIESDPEKLEAQVHDLRNTLNEINTGKVRLNIPDNLDELRATQEKQKELNRLYAAIKGTYQVLGEGGEITLDHRRRFRHRDRVYNFDLSNQTYGEFMREVNRYVGDRGDDIDPENDPIIILRNQLERLYTHSQETLQPHDVNDMMFRMDRSRVDDPNKIFERRSRRQDTIVPEQTWNPTATIINQLFPRTN